MSIGMSLIQTPRFTSAGRVLSRNGTRIRMKRFESSLTNCGKGLRVEERLSPMYD
jgi:hypothetical protein